MTSARVPGVDGLRAIAVLLVLGFHLAPDGVLPGGFLGVDVFFVISGFLITSLLLREHAATGRIRLRTFWARRARRLLPALVMLLLACGAAAAWVGGDVLVHLGAQLLGALTFSTNWLLVAQGSDYFAGSAPELFRNLWSLAVEEQFYLAWPLLMLLLLRTPRRARPWIAGALTLGALGWMCALAPHASVDRLYYGTDSHAVGLLAGALLATLLPGSVARPDTDAPAPAAAPSPRRASRAIASVAGVLGLAAIVALAAGLPDAFAGDATLLPIGIAAASAASALVLRALTVPGAAIGRVLDAGPLRWLGRRSYGLYLWHWPVLVLLTQSLPTWQSDPSLRWALGGIAAAVSLVAAALSFAIVENPIRRDGFRRSARLAFGWWRWGRGSRAVASLAAAAVVLAGVATGIGVAADPGRTSGQQAVEAGRRELASPDAHPSASLSRSPGPHGPSSTPSPSPSAGYSGADVLVIGDSVTVAATPALEAALPGVLVDAAVSRQMAQAPAIVAQHAAQKTLRPVTVLALGTNGPFPISVLDDVRRELGQNRSLILVTSQEPRGWEQANNDLITAYAARYRNVELSDWHAAIQPHLDQLARDQVHFGGFGARLWTSCLMDALQRLAATPRDPPRWTHPDLAKPT